MQSTLAPAVPQHLYGTCTNHIGIMLACEGLSILKPVIKYSLKPYHISILTYQ